MHFQLLRRHIFVATFIYLLFLPAPAQNKPDPQQRTANIDLSKKAADSSGSLPVSETWMNIPSSPVIIKNKDQSMRLAKVSSGKVVEYQLGCVVGKPSEYKLLSLELPVQTVRAANAKNKKQDSYPIVMSDGLLNTCSTKNGQVAVVRVLFDDGNSWSAVGGASVAAAAPTVGPKSPPGRFFRHPNRTITSRAFTRSPVR